MSIVWVTHGGSSIAMLEYLALDKEHGEWRAAAWESSVAIERLSDMEGVWELTRAAWSQHGGRQYAHTSLSLDPNDPRALAMRDQDLLDYARAWAERCIPEGSDWVAVVHRDEPQPHVHLVWGTTHADTGRKWRQSRKWLRESIKVKDELDMRFGLRVTPLRQPAARIHRNAARIIGRGGYSWQLDLQARVDRAREAARSWVEFEARLAADGVSLRHTRQGDRARVGYHFYDERGKPRGAREGRLGGLYERSYIEAQIAQRSGAGRATAAGRPAYRGRGAAAAATAAVAVDPGRAIREAATARGAEAYRGRGEATATTRGVGGAATERATPRVPRRRKTSGAERGGTPVGLPRAAAAGARAAASGTDGRAAAAGRDAATGAAALQGPGGALDPTQASARSHRPATAKGKQGAADGPVRGAAARAGRGAIDPRAERDAPAGGRARESSAPGRGEDRGAAALSSTMARRSAAMPGSEGGDQARDGLAETSQRLDAQRRAGTREAIEAARSAAAAVDAACERVSGLVVEVGNAVRKAAERDPSRTRAKEKKTDENTPPLW